MIQNCQMCGKVLEYNVSGLREPLCEPCRVRDSETYDKVRDYIFEHKGATILDITENLDVGLKTIRRYLREGRLYILENDKNKILFCESCKKPIPSGRFCTSCLRQESITEPSSSKILGNPTSNDTETVSSRGPRFKNTRNNIRFR